MAEQRVLTFTVDGKKYRSKPFDFEAFRLTNENHADEAKKGAVTCGLDGVYHMFEGTDATNDVLAKASIHDMSDMCRKVWDWYVEELTSKND
jgi:hypothetical protein